MQYSHGDNLPSATSSPGECDDGCNMQLGDESSDRSGLLQTVSLHGKVKVAVVVYWVSVGI